MSYEPDRLLPIGRFPQATGLTVKAMRHYDDAGLLRRAVRRGTVSSANG